MTTKQQYLELHIMCHQILTYGNNAERDIARTIAYYYDQHANDDLFSLMLHLLNKVIDRFNG